MPFAGFDLPFLNIAHRGARAISPENTLASARSALDAGSHLWELDVSMSRDGIPVVVHDATLERTSNVKEVFPHRRPWRVDSFSLDELRRLDVGSWFLGLDPFGRIAEGRVTPSEANALRGLPLPTLREALQWTLESDWLVNVEIKDARDTAHDRFIVEAVVRLIQALDMENRVLVSSFNHDYLSQVRRRSSRLVTGALVEQPHQEPERLLKELGIQSYHPHKNAVSPEQIRRLKNKGFPTLVWVVNEEHEMMQWIQAGTWGLFTDFPHRLAKVLKSRFPEFPGSRT